MNLLAVILLAWTLLSIPVSLAVGQFCAAGEPRKESANDLHRHP